MIEPSRRRLLLAILISLLLVACTGRATGVSEPVDEPSLALETLLAQYEGDTPGSSDDPSRLPLIDPGTVRGDITVAGSSTVFPLTEAMAERFTDEGYAGQITVASIGSGAGFERFCVEAETDVSNASRPIKAGEIEACRAAGREPLEFRVGTDALAITVSRDNDFVESLTLEQLARAFSGEAATWADLDPAWPAEAIELFSPGTDSGTFDYFVEAVLEEEAARILAVEGVQYSEDDNVLVSGIEGSPYAIGYFGYAYYLENQDRLRVLAIDGIEPTAETAEDGSYPLSRPLYIYSAPSVMGAKPQVAAFIAYYLTFVNDEIVEVGYFPASQETLDQARALWLDAVE